MGTPPVERLAYSPNEAAVAVGLSIGTIYGLIKRGKLAAFKCERRILISREDLAAFVNQQKNCQRNPLEPTTGSRS